MPQNLIKKKKKPTFSDVHTHYKIQIVERTFCYEY